MDGTDQIRFSNSLSAGYYLGVAIGAALCSKIDANEINEMRGFVMTDFRWGGAILRTYFGLMMFSKELLRFPNLSFIGGPEALLFLVYILIIDADNRMLGISAFAIIYVQYLFINRKLVKKDLNRNSARFKKRGRAKPS